MDLVNFGQSKFPSFSGFLAEEIPTPQRVELVRENYDGKVYNVGIIRKLLLFPQHTGERFSSFTLAPASGRAGRLACPCVPPAFPLPFTTWIVRGLERYALPSTVTVAAGKSEKDEVEHISMVISDRFVGEGPECGI